MPAQPVARRQRVPCCPQRHFKYGNVAQHGRLTAMLCRGLEKNDIVRAWHGRGMASVNQTRPHCVNQMGKAHSKPLAARHGRGTAWARHAMCESALNCLLAKTETCRPTRGLIKNPTSRVQRTLSRF